LLVDERGVPLSIVVTGANRHDVTQVDPVLGTRVFSPGKDSTVFLNLCADAGYTGNPAHHTMVSKGYVPHVRSRGEESRLKTYHPDFKSRRWVVEASHSWFNRFRKLAIRYEKTHASFLALHHLAAAIIALRKIGIIYG